MAEVMGQLILESPQMAPVALVLAAVALGAMVVLYGPQSRGLGWGWRTWLWVLRGGAILAVVGSVVKPAVLRARRAGEDLAAVVVLIDTSRSMQVRDYAAATTQPLARTPDATTMPVVAGPRPSGEVEQTLVALADGLGYLPAGTRSGRMVSVDSDLGHVMGLLDDLRQVRSELDYARLSGRGVESAEARGDDVHSGGGGGGEAPDGFRGRPAVGRFGAAHPGRSGFGIIGGGVVTTAGGVSGA
jgi:hypothetical protein